MRLSVINGVRDSIKVSERLGVKGSKRVRGIMRVKESEYLGVKLGTKVREGESLSN